MSKPHSDDIRYIIEALDTLRIPVERDPDDITAVTVVGRAEPIDASSKEVCELFFEKCGDGDESVGSGYVYGKVMFCVGRCAEDEGEADSRFD